ncbi:MAG: hypothetical protein ACHP7N_16935 [Caulobacterales bacterium]
MNLVHGPAISFNPQLNNVWAPRPDALKARPASRSVGARAVLTRLRQSASAGEATATVVLALAPFAIAVATAIA